MKKLLSFLALFLCISKPDANVAHAQQGWILQSSPVPDPLGRIYFANLSEGWIAADGGVVLHTTNGGADWLIQDPEPTDPIRFLSSPGVPLSFINATTGWLIGTVGGLFSPNGAVLYKTTNGGAAWSRQDLTPWTNGFTVQFIDANNGWAIVGTGTFPDISGAIIHTTDGGSTWSSQLTADRKVAVLSFIDVNNGWIALDSLDSSGDLIPPLEILHTANGGTTWSSQLLENTGDGYNDIQFTDLNNGWVIGNSATMLRTTNGGVNWNPISNTGVPPGSDNVGLFFLDANTGWVGNQLSGNSPIVLHTTDGGSFWTMQNPIVQFKVFSIYFVDGDNGWLSADFGGIAHTTNGGGTTSVRDEDQSEVPPHFALEQNYPNPLNPTTTIKFELPRAGPIVLKVYDMLGREITTLVNDERSQGTYEVHFDATGLSSGVYVYRLQAGIFVETKRLILLK